MALPFVVVGDKTDHGGTVVEADPTTDTHGKRIARVGDKVTCPKRGHGPTTIVTGDPTMLIDGKPAARHGDKCACGATLIASQAVSTTGGEGGSRASRSSTAADALAALHDLANALPFDEQVRAVDAETGEPLADLAYFIEAPDGKTYAGRTNADGLCPRVSTFSAAELSVWFGEDAERKQVA